jgi:hypothetical protein
VSASKPGSAGLLSNLSGSLGRWPDGPKGAHVVYHEPYIASTLDKRIENGEDRLRVAEELLAMIIRPMSPAASPTLLTVDPNSAAAPTT